MLISFPLGIFLFGKPTLIGLLVDDGCDDRLPVRLFLLSMLVSSSVPLCSGSAGPTVFLLCSSNAAGSNLLVSLKEFIDVERYVVVRCEVSESIRTDLTASFRPESLDTVADTGLLVLSISVESSHSSVAFIHVWHTYI